MKKILCVLLCALMLLPYSASCAGGMSPPPALDDVRGRIIELIEGSYAINEIFYGEGLPVIEVGSDEDLKYDIYKDRENVIYEYVSADTAFVTIESIKLAAEKIYDSEFLESGAYIAMFSGHSEEGISGVNHARYKEIGNTLCKFRDTDYRYYNYINGKKRVYNYDTMELEAQSNANRIYVKMDTHLEGEDKIKSLTLQLVLRDNVWYLATMTY